MDTKNKLEFLNGLRGWAAFIVLIHHTLIYFIGTINPFFAGKMFAFITDGHLALIIFFVLSGFVLSIKFIPQPGTTSLAVAATSRYFRLVIPIAVTSFLAYALMCMGLMFNSEAAHVSANGTGINVWLLEFYQFPPSFVSYMKFSFYSVFHYIYNDPIYNSNLWTMPPEFQGSMLIYLVLGVFRREAPGQIFYLPVLIIAAIFFVTDTPIACILFGYFLAEIYHRWKQPIEQWKYRNLFFGGVTLAVVYISTFHRPTDDMYFSILAVMMVTAAAFCDPLRHFFNCEASQFLGKISYPLYLIHIIVICSLSSYLLFELPQWGVALWTTSYIVATITIFVSLCAAYMFLPLEKFSILASKRIAQKLVGYKIFVS